MFPTKFPDISNAVHFSLSLPYTTMFFLTKLFFSHYQAVKATLKAIKFSLKAIEIYSNFSYFYSDLFPSKKSTH